MTTIAKTGSYRELTYRLLKLMQLYSVLSEFNLHLNTAVDKDTAQYYFDTLYTLSDYGSFLTASIESMKQVFYIELDGFIGAYWDSKSRDVKKRKYETGSLGAYLYDKTRSVRKKSAQTAFEKLLKDKKVELTMVHDLRGNLAHFPKLKKRNNSFAPGDVETREILNRLAEVMYLLGFQKWNSPHYIEQESTFTESTQRVVDALIFHRKDYKEIRKQYLKARTKWFGTSSN